MKYLWPIISVTLLVILVGIGAFYLGSKKSDQKDMVVPTPTVLQTNNSNAAPTQAITSTQSQTQTIEAGGILVFKSYKLSAPSDWVVSKEKNAYMDTVTLTKLNYKLTISQAAGGGGGCTYPGQAPAEMAQSFVSFIEINNTSGFIFRRGQNENGPNTYTVCQKNASDGSFGFPTSFGNITLTTPGTPDKNQYYLSRG